MQRKKNKHKLYHMAGRRDGREEEDKRYPLECRRGRKKERSNRVSELWFCCPPLP